MSELYERYEEALFRLLMEQVTQKEGESLFERNALLLTDPMSAVPIENSNRCLEYLRRCLTRGSRRRIFRIALTVMATMLALTAFAYAAIPQVRVDFKNALLEIRGDKTIEYTYLDDQFVLGEGVLYKVSLPLTFYETEHIYWELAHAEEVSYASAEDDTVSLWINVNYLGEEGNATVLQNRENATIEEERELFRNGENVKAEMIGDEYELFVNWRETAFRAVVYVDACGLKPEQLWEIVESMEVFPPSDRQ